MKRTVRVEKRECGTCTACCTVLAVAELKKEGWEDCSHCTGKSCGIYSVRPEQCRNYLCGWRMGLGGRDDRPNTIGALIDVQNQPVSQSVRFTVFTFADEQAKADGISDAVIRAVEQVKVASVQVLVVPHGVRPGTPVTAFRGSVSSPQDADSLRQLAFEELLRVIPAKGKDEPQDSASGEP